MRSQCLSSVTGYRQLTIARIITLTEAIVPPLPGVCFSSVGLKGPASILRKDAPGCKRPLQTDVAGVNPEEPTPALPICGTAATISKFTALLVFLGAHSLHFFRFGLSQLASN